MILMHRNIPVAEVEILYGRNFAVRKIFASDHMPFGTVSESPKLVPLLMKSWNDSRAIPHQRQNLYRIEKALGCNIDVALAKSHNVSLTDCYWTKENESDPLSWEDVNCHDNGFQEELAHVIYHDRNLTIRNFNTPDLTTDGVLEKAWVVSNNVPVLLKSGNLGRNACGKDLLSANEVAASRVASLMDIPHVNYFPVSIAGTDRTVCGCECFIHDSSKDFINLLQLRNHFGHISSLELYGNLCRSGFKEDLDRMIVFDHILHNTDRHEKNAGIIRDAETMEPISFAPLFDNGSILAWNKTEATFDTGETKPFVNNRRGQLRLADTTCILIPSEEEIGAIIRDTYEQFGIDEKCYSRAIADLGESFEQLEEVQKEKRNTVYFHDTENRAPVATY